MHQEYFEENYYRETEDLGFEETEFFMIIEVELKKQMKSIHKPRDFMKKEEIRLE